MENELSDIIDKLRAIIKSKGLRIDDSQILSESMKLYISNKISQNKKENIKDMSLMKNLSNPNLLKPKEDMATDKQLNFLYKLGYKGNCKLTKKEATIKIKELAGGY